MDAAFAQVEAAADLGTGIHNALDLAFDGQPFDPQYEPYVRPVLEWISKTGITFTARELVLVNKAEGYAGRVDALFTFGKRGLGIIDWKTRKRSRARRCRPTTARACSSPRMPRRTTVPRLFRCTRRERFHQHDRTRTHGVCKHDNLPDLYETFTQAAPSGAPQGYDPRDGHVSAAAEEAVSVDFETEYSATYNVGRSGTTPTVTTRVQRLPRGRVDGETTIVTHPVTSTGS
jgi:hypothetical protein